MLLVGHTGVGKTALIESVLLGLDISISSFTINFSAGTTAPNTQEIIESNFERRTKNKYRPKNAKKTAICFIDDLNMPRRDTFGSQPPLELIRQWIDYTSWYDRVKLSLNYIFDLQFLCAMGKPGGGRAVISRRLQSKFHIINFTIPADSQIKRIYEAIAAYKFQVFEEEIKGLAEPLALATINLFTIPRRALAIPINWKSAIGCWRLAVHFDSKPPSARGLSAPKTGLSIASSEAEYYRQMQRSIPGIQAAH